MLSIHVTRMCIENRCFLCMWLYMTMAAATPEVGERNDHYIQRFWRSEIGTLLTIHGLRSPQLAWPILAA
jgi:hypothetical protein